MLPIFRILSRNTDNTRFRSLNALKIMPRVIEPNLAGLYILYHAGFVKQGDRIIFPDNTPVDRAAGVLAMLDSMISHQSAQLALRKAEQEVKDRLANERVAQMREERLKREKEEKEAALKKKEEERLEMERRKAELERKAQEEAAAREAQRLKEREERIAKSMESGLTLEQAEEKERQLERDEEMAKQVARQMEEEERQQAEELKRSKRLKMGDDDEEIDPELLKLAEEIKKKGASGAPLPAKQKKDIILTLEEKEKVALMTADEKKAWFDKKRAEMRAKMEADEAEKARQAEINRMQQGKAMLDLRSKQEELERLRVEEAHRQKKKEEAAQRAAMNKLQHKLKEDQERRRLEKEARLKELEKIRAEKEGKGGQ